MLQKAPRFHHPYYLLLVLGQVLYLFLVHHSQLWLRSQMQHSCRPTRGEQLAPQEAHGSQGEDNISEWQTMGRSPKCTFVHLVSHQFHQLSVLAGSSLRFMKNRRAHWCFLLHQLGQLENDDISNFMDTLLSSFPYKQKGCIFCSQ